MTFDLASSSVPALVSATWRVVRVNSGVPSSRSRRRISSLSVGAARCSRSAARPKCSSVATATNASSWRNSTARRYRARRYCSVRPNNDLATCSFLPGQHHANLATVPRPQEASMTFATLVGRDEELGLIAAFLEQAAGGKTLLFTGEPGVGKTALLDAAEQAALAAGLEVLRTAGSEFGTRVSFSGLAQLLHPLSGCLPSLSPLHRRALSAIDGDAEPAQDRLVVFQAALALLGEAGGRH